MTTSPSDAPESEVAESAVSPEIDPLAEYAASVAGAVGGEARVDFETIKVQVSADEWVGVLTKAKEDLGLIFFSWLSAVDWANEVRVGDAPGADVTERYEVIAAVSDLDEGRIVLFTTDIPKENSQIETLTSVYTGADWHEREAHDMFGIDFVGHPDLSPLYLPDGFEGHPLRKSYPLLAREVKPWPGKVDVEAIPEGPSEENPEA